jgi:hypothetical protein
MHRCILSSRVLEKFRAFFETFEPLLEEVKLGVAPTLAFKGHLTRHLIECIFRDLESNAGLV